jgi:arylsulfatase A-like enzyme
VRARKHLILISGLGLAFALLAGTALTWRLAGGRREPAGPPSAPRPNIVVVLIDALRADRLGAYGCARPLTPAIDALAAEGVLFERAISQAPWTQPSVASLFSACYPSVHRVRDYHLAYDGTFRQKPTVPVFDPSFRTLAEVLHDAGYQTAAFSANPFVAPHFGFDQGFEHFDASGASFSKEAVNGGTLNAAVFDWLGQRDAARPCFLYVHYMDVHGPYDGDHECLSKLLDEVERLPDKTPLSPEVLAQMGAHLRWMSPDFDAPRHERLMNTREYWLARYDAGVRAADRYFAELRAGLAARGLWDNSYVVLLADHGESLAEHGFWDHGLSVYDPEVHVPLILRWPGRLGAGQRIAQTVEQFDLLPTLAEQLGLPAVEGVQGVSLAPLLAGQPLVRRPEALAEAVKAGREQKALYQGNYKLLLVEGEQPRAALFDRVTDPGELKNIAAAARADFEQLLGTLHAVVDRNRLLARGQPAQQAPITEAQRRQLESLGYVGDQTPAETRAPATLEHRGAGAQE